MRVYNFYFSVQKIFSINTKLRKIKIADTTL